MLWKNFIFAISFTNQIKKKKNFLCSLFEIQWMLLDEIFLRHFLIPSLIPSFIHFITLNCSDASHKILKYHITFASTTILLMVNPVKKKTKCMKVLNFIHKWNQNQHECNDFW